MVHSRFVSTLYRYLRPYARVGAFGALGCVFGVIIVTSILALQYSTSSDSLVTPTTPIGLSRFAPTMLRMPALGLTIPFEAPLGLNPDKTVMVPIDYQKVGWYQYGATPGEVGTAVVLGHVDSVDGPAAFYNLPNLKEGDTIEVDRVDGTTAVFKVDRLVTYKQADFPTEAVYAPTPEPTLRLITCTGTFNKGTQRYSHNFVVYASLVD